MRKIFKEFKEFISRGNVVDMAIAFVISTSFSAIVTALVKNVIMPLIAAIFGKVDVTALSFTINNSVIPVGLFIQAVIDFLLIAFFLFLVIKAINTSKNIAEKGKKRKVTKEEKKEIAALGTVDMKNRKAVYEAAVELRAKKAAEAEAEKARLAAKAETTENLLKQIRDLLSDKNTVETKETTVKKSEKKSK